MRKKYYPKNVLLINFFSGLPLAVKDLMLWDSSNANNTFSLRWLKLSLHDSGYLPLVDYQIKISGVNGEIGRFNVPLEESVFPRNTNMNYEGMYW